MRKEWKLLPVCYRYRYSKIIFGIGFDAFIVAFLFRSIDRTTLFYINEKAVTFQEFMYPICAMLIFGLILASLDIRKNITVHNLRKEIELLKQNFRCYDGTIESIERIQVNEVTKSQASNIYNKNTHVLNRAVVNYLDEDGRKRIASSEEYDEYLSVFLKDTKAKVYVSKSGNNRIVDDLSWRQSSKDDYIDVPGGETKSVLNKPYYWLARYQGRLATGCMLIVFLIILFITVI